MGPVTRGVLTVAVHGLVEHPPWSAKASKCKQGGGSKGSPPTPVRDLGDPNFSTIAPDEVIGNYLGNAVEICNVTKL